MIDDCRAGFSAVVYSNAVAMRNCPIEAELRSSHSQRRMERIGIVPLATTGPAAQHALVQAVKALSNLRTLARRSPSPLDLLGFGQDRAAAAMPARMARVG